jgi:hypothetical protein
MDLSAVCFLVPHEQDKHMTDQQLVNGECCGEPPSKFIGAPKLREVKRGKDCEFMSSRSWVRPGIIRTSESKRSMLYFIIRPLLQGRRWSWKDVLIRSLHV